MNRIKTQVDGPRFQTFLSKLYFQFSLFTKVKSLPAIRLINCALIRK